MKLILTISFNKILHFGKKRLIMTKFQKEKNIKRIKCLSNYKTQEYL